MRNTVREKVLVIAAAAAACAAAVGLTAYAAGGQRREAVISHGMINYDNGRIIIDSADLITLADETDKLEVTYKTDIVNALAQIGTYIQQDGTVSHENAADIDPGQVAFGDLTAGILCSQSAAHLANTQASDLNGPIYYKFEKNNILEVTGSDTGMPVFIVPATEDNLTLQTAAWVNGKCLTGNGADSYYFYQKGFIEGYAEKAGAAVEYKYDETGRVEFAKLIFP